MLTSADSSTKGSAPIRSYTARILESNVPLDSEKARLILRGRNLAKLRIGDRLIRCPEKLMVEEISGVKAQLKRNPLPDFDRSLNIRHNIVNGLLTNAINSRWEYPQIVSIRLAGWVGDETVSTVSAAAVSIHRGGRDVCRIQPLDIEDTGRNVGVIDGVLQHNVRCLDSTHVEEVAPLKQCAVIQFIRCIDTKAPEDRGHQT